MNNKKIYPQIDTQFGSDFIKLETWVRKKGRDDKYYLCNIIRSLHNSMFTGKEINAVHKQFHAEVYNFIILGIPIPEAVYLNGHKAFILDENQDTEEERIKKILML